MLRSKDRECFQLFLEIESYVMVFFHETDTESLVRHHCLIFPQEEINPSMYVTVAYSHFLHIRYALPKLNVHHQ